MKLASSNFATSRRQRAFTMVEALVASTTLIILVAAVILSNLFGLAMAIRQQIWIGASSDAVQAIGTLTSDIRSAVSMQVGSYQSGVFTQTAITNQQTGSARMICTTSNATPWILYYYDTVTSNMYRTNYNGAGVPGDFKWISANPITNDSTHPIFSELDTSGTGAIITNFNSVAPVSIYLSFIKLQNPQVVIQDGSLVDLYQLTTTVTPRLVLTQ